MKMENTEEVFHFLEEFSKRKPKIIPQELNDYLAYVARTGDPVYQWPLVKSLFKEKLLNVITDFYETSPGIDIPPYPNVDPFNYDTMKNSLLERLDTFTSAPFTVQRICELLTYPRKQYNRVDKFMRAIEKNILVVSTREPGMQRHIEPENGEPMEPIVNGSDNNSEYNVDVEMEDMSWKENSEQQKQQTSEPQPSSSDSHITVHDIEARLRAKKDAAMNTQEKVTTQYESVTPPELNITPDAPIEETKTTEPTVPSAISTSEEQKPESTDITEPTEIPKTDVEMKPEEPENSSSQPLVIPEIKIDDAAMTEQKLNEQSDSNDVKITEEKEKPAGDEPIKPESKPISDSEPTPVDESSSDSNKEDTEPKLISEVSTSSEESSSSSDITDGNSNSPKTDEAPIDVQEESSQSDTNTEPEVLKEIEPPAVDDKVVHEDTPPVSIQSDNYSISDVNSELPQPPPEESKKSEEPLTQEVKDNQEVVESSETEKKEDKEQKADNTEMSSDTTPS